MARRPSDLRVLRIGNHYIASYDLVDQTDQPDGPVRRGWLYDSKIDRLSRYMPIISLMNHGPSGVPWESIPADEVPPRLLEQIAAADPLAAH